ncbi:MAG: DUF72 domain-containing protein [Candidatus Acetothermia bacterium]|jgi:uncharacterized protein YecE (DUF72 family)|nr:DUF72 domain-containing protein [Candidatus Acetothermia bacterium]
MPRFRIGCSGWVYPHWAGPFYPGDSREKDWFAFYARHFDTVEVNSTFYHFPREATVRGWAEKSPDGFLFTLKAWRGITHLRKFKGTEDLVRRFYAVGAELGDKLGGVLFQLPPTVPYNPGVLARILDQLDPTYRNTLEFRHPSWFNDEVAELLHERGVAMCIVSAPGLPEFVVATASHAFVRFHGREEWYAYRYSEEELRGWAGRLSGLPVDMVFAYFNNDAFAWAPENALRLKELVQAPTPDRANPE